MGDYVKMVLVLAGVVGSIYLLFYFLKKGARKHLPDNGIIKLLSTYHLQGNSLLFLVEVGTNIYLVSSGDGKLNLISEIKDKESIDTIRLAATEENSGVKKNFNDILFNFFKPAGPLRGNSDKQANVNSPVEKENPLDFIKSQRGRLEKLR